MDNKIAEIHMLDRVEFALFKSWIAKIEREIQMICEEQQLEGRWQLSEDCKFLRKIGDK